MTTGYDINKKRLDGFDRSIIVQSLDEPFDKRTICNFGSGESRLSCAVAAVGHRVYNFDERDLHRYFTLQQELGLSNYFVHTKLEDIKRHQLPQQIDIAVFQRVLHYLPYQEVKKILKLVLGRVRPRGYVFISFSGIDSELGVGYEAGDQAIGERWGMLSAENQKKFDISVPLCLYSLEDATVLCSSLPKIAVHTIATTPFGNIQVVMQKV